jgi:hypothetical protein
MQLFSFLVRVYLSREKSMIQATVRTEKFTELCPSE